MESYNTVHLTYRDEYQNRILSGKRIIIPENGLDTIELSSKLGLALSKLREWRKNETYSDQKEKALEQPEPSLEQKIENLSEEITFNALVIKILAGGVNLQLLLDQIKQSDTTNNQSEKIRKEIIAICLILKAQLEELFDQKNLRNLRNQIKTYSVIYILPPTAY